MNTKIKKRDEYWDLLKGIAILLMVFGHSIQYGMGENYFNDGIYLNNKVFHFIYGFHMPLFMFISGYFFYNSANKRNYKDIIIKNIKTLIIPICAFYLVHIILQIITDWNSLNTTLSFEFIKDKFVGVLWFLWFLWAVFLSSMILGGGKYLNINHIALQIIIIIILYSTPDYGPYSSGFKFIYPFYVLGYYARKYDYLNRLCSIKKRYSILLLLAYTLSIIFLYTKETLVYTTGCYIFKNSNYLFTISQIIIRFIIGLLGILSIISITLRIKAKLTRSNNILKSYIVKTGLYSLGIYCIQNELVVRAKDLEPFPKSQIMSCIITFIIVFTVSYFLTHIISKNTILNRLFLGGR